MRVYDVNLTSSSMAQTGRTQETQSGDRVANGRSGTSGGAGSDRVELSSTLGHLAQALAADGSNRAARVQALAAQYQSGRYQADSMATGRGMIAEALAGAAQ